MLKLPRISARLLSASARLPSHHVSEALEHGVLMRRFVPAAAEHSATIVMLHGAGETGELVPRT
jgi:hypothetical protein